MEYEVIHQVAYGVPSYEIKDSSGNVNVTHCNQHFLLATLQGEATPLCKSKDADTSISTQSALAELIPLECEMDLLKHNVEGCLTQHLTIMFPWWFIEQHNKTKGQE